MAWKRSQVQILYSPHMNFLRSIPKAPVFLTLLFTAFIAAIKYPFDFFWSAYDANYHAVHSQSYFENFEITYPAFTYLSQYPADLWYLYHLLIGALYFGGNNFFALTADQALMTAHIIFAAFLCGVIFWFLNTLFKFMHSEIKTLAPAWYGILLLAFSLGFPMFTFRMFFVERPHVLMVALTLIAFISVIRKQYFWLFTVSILAPLSYSFSLFIFLPLVTVIIGWLITVKKLKSCTEIDKTIFSTIAGFSIGVVLHPNSVGYLINGLGFHSFAIAQSMLWMWPTQVSKLIIPEEMQLLQIELPIFYSLLGAGLLLALDIYRRRVKEGKDVKEGETYRAAVFTGMIVMSLLLLFASLFVSRAMEYALPLALVTFLTTIPFIGSEIKTLSENVVNNANSKIGKFFRWARNLGTFLLVKLWFRMILVLVFVFVVSGSIRYGYLPVAEEVRSSSVDYSQAALYLQENTTKDEVVLQANFFTYPQLLKTSPELNYSIGMDARMIYFYDPKLSYLYNSVFRSGECYKECPYTPEEGLRELRSRYEINYVVFDTEFMEEQMYEFFEDTNRFELVFSNSSDDRIRIYKILQL